MIKLIARLGIVILQASRRLRISGACALAMCAACEAPLDLVNVEAEQARIAHRYDMFQGVAHKGEQVAVVSSVGAVLLSRDGGRSWERNDLPGRPALIDVTACETGRFYALDTTGHVWHGTADAESWQPSTIDTPEDTLSVHCAPDGRIWVSASFSTLFWAEPDLARWNEFSLYEDLQFTAVRFLDSQNGFALGEFGTVIATRDGGENWEPLPPIPNDFYPMAVDFLDASTGWAGGLDGVIWQTEDGGQTWVRQETVTSSPVYNIHANGNGVYAVGGSAKLVELRDGRWENFEGAPKVLAYMRGLDTLPTGDLVVAGGGGTLAVIPLRGRKS